MEAEMMLRLNILRILRSAENRGRYETDWYWAFEQLEKLATDPKYQFEE